MKKLIAKLPHQEKGKLEKKTFVLVGTTIAICTSLYTIIIQLIL